MSLESTNIQAIYSGKMATKYELSLPHSFAKWKRKAFKESALKIGDRVLVFCCGTGLDFPHILEKIGKEGSIIGVDISAEMLKIARRNITKRKWGNIELIEADVSKFEDKLDVKADVGVCTLGLSIIPDYKSAYYNLLSNVKKQGEIIIGDMQLATGRFARLNPLTVFVSKGFGGSFEGHQNSLELYSLIKKELSNVKKREFFFKSYYYCIAKKN